MIFLIEFGKHFLLNTKNINVNLERCLKFVPLSVFNERVYPAKKNISIKLSAKENVDFLFLGEATLIQQSIQNLLDNAIKWSPKDQTVEVVLESEEKQLIVKILDHGPGVSEEIRDKLFLPFVGDESFSDSTGLGLALVKRVAQLHGGYARYIRTPEGLTQFELVFLKKPIFMS